MGRARTRRAGPGRGDAPAIPSQAAARPDGGRARRGAALALVGRAPHPRPARGRAVANAMAAPDYSHKWETLRPAERRLSAASASPNSPIPRRKRRRSRWRCARRWRRPARRPRWSRPTGSSRRACRRCSRAGASRPTTARASRCRRRRAGTLLLGIAAPRRKSWRRSSLLALAQASAGRRRGRGARSPGSTRCARSTSSCAGRGRRPGSPGSTRNSRKTLPRVAGRARHASEPIDGLLDEPDLAGRSSRDALAAAAQALAGDAAVARPGGADGGRGAGRARKRRRRRSD